MDLIETRQLIRAPLQQCTVGDEADSCISGQSHHPNDRINARVKKRLATIETTLPDASPIKKVELIQERSDLTVELATMGAKVDLSGLEKGFVKSAKTYSERKGITYSTWREVGVPADVLKRAGITRGA